MAIRKRPLSRSEWIRSLTWNIADAREALVASISMNNWTGARKYISQIEKMERQLYNAESGPHTISGASGSRAYVSTRARKSRRA